MKKNCLTNRAKSIQVKTKKQKRGGNPSPTSITIDTHTYQNALVVRENFQILLLSVQNKQKKVKKTGE